MWPESRAAVRVAALNQEDDSTRWMMYAASVVLVLLVWIDCRWIHKSCELFGR